MNLELVIIPLLVIVSTLLLFRNFKQGLTILLVLSVLLHKEVFSIYMWDVLPVRVFMLSLSFYAGLRFLNWGIYRRNIAEVKEFLTDPYNTLLIAMWVVSAVSIIFSKNIQASLFLLAFLFNIVILGILLKKELYGKTEDIFRYIHYFIILALVLTLFGFFQLYLYGVHNIIIGALWNVPGNIARVGSTFWDVNHFGAFLAVLLPVVGALLLTAESLKLRLFYFISLIPLTFVLLLTNSRTAWIIAAVSLITFVSIFLFRKIGLKGIGYIGVALLLISIPLFLEYRQKDSSFRAQIKDYFHYRMDSFDSHMFLITGTIQIFEKYPVLGGGYGGFYEHFSETEIAPTYFGRDPAGLTTRVPAHTIWGEIISETGSIGLLVNVLLYGLILIIPLYAALTLPRFKDYILTGAMASAILGWYAAGVFYSYKSEYFWLILFLYYLYSASLLSKNSKYSLKTLISYFSLSKFAAPAVLALLGAVIILVNLGKIHLFPWDEAIYAQIAKNMYLSGNYLDMTWLRDNSIWLEKPPLYMWSSAFWMHLIGINEWAPRLTSALLGFGTVLLTYLFGTKLFGKYVGFLSGLVILTTVDFVKFSRQGMTDVSVTFFITLALYFYYIGRKGKYYHWVLSGTAIGLAVMTKGVVGFLPFVIIGLYETIMLLTKDSKFSLTILKNYALIIGTSLLVFMPWHIIMYLRYGQKFIDIYIDYHILQRATTAIEDKGKPFYWYFVVLKVSMRLWFIALLGAFPFSLYKILSEKSKKLLFLVLWSLVIFIFFSSATSKLVWYIMPIYPALSIIVAYFISSFVSLISARLPKYSLQIRSSAMFLVTFVALIYFTIIRGMYIFSDLTGAQATLLQRKDVAFGVTHHIYADTIELPLVLYYTDGPLSIVDLTHLKLAIKEGVKTNDQVVFITKEGRFGELLEIYPSLLIESAHNEWVLGYLPVKPEEPLPSNGTSIELPESQ